MENFKKFSALIILALIYIFVMAVAAWWLWNNTMPNIFGLPELTYLQTVQIMLLINVLFGCNNIYK